MLDLGCRISDSGCVMEEASTKTAAGEREGHRSWGLLFLGVAFLLVLYVLSPGLVGKLARGRPGPPPRVVAVLYAPLQLLYQNSPMVKRFYDWYFQDVWKIQ